MKAPCPPSPRHAGIPYRRGYLLHGPPGTGKTSLVAALAGALQLPIYVASLGSGRLSDDSFAEALAGAAKRCVLLLEDVDAAFGAARDAQHGGGLTFSGVLNALDGVAAQEGRLLFLTTGSGTVEIFRGALRGLHRTRCESEPTGESAYAAFSSARELGIARKRKRLR